MKNLVKKVMKTSKINTKKLLHKKKNTLKVSNKNVDLAVDIVSFNEEYRPTTSTELLDLWVINENDSIAKKKLYEIFNNNIIESFKEFQLSENVHNNDNNNNLINEYNVNIE